MKLFQILVQLAPDDTRLFRPLTCHHNEGEIGVWYRIQDDSTGVPWIHYADCGTAVDDHGWATTSMLLHVEWELSAPGHIPTEDEK